MFQLLVISSKDDAGVHQIVLEFPTPQEADTAFDNIVAAKKVLRTSTYAVKLY